MIQTAKNVKSEHMSKVNINDIKVKVTPSIGKKQPDGYLWSYNVVIKNNTNSDITLKERFWKAVNTDGEVKEFKGYSVGDVVKIKKSSKYEYINYITMPCHAAIMYGYYMIRIGRKIVRVDIGPSFLVSSDFIEGGSIINNNIFNLNDLDSEV